MKSLIFAVLLGLLASTAHSAEFNCVNVNGQEICSNQPMVVVSGISGDYPVYKKEIPLAQLDPQTPEKDSTALSVVMGTLLLAFYVVYWRRKRRTSKWTN